MLDNLKRKATELSHHYFDFSRIAQLVGHHRYSLHEIAQRAPIVASFIVGGYVGYQQASNRFVGALVGSISGFVMSHTVIIAPLLWKRYQFSVACQQSELAIKQLIHDYSLRGVVPEGVLEAYVLKIADSIQKIMALSLTTEKQGNASQTWGKKARLMKDLEQVVQSDLKTAAEAAEPNVSMLSCIEQWPSQPALVFSALEKRAYLPVQSEPDWDASLNPAGTGNYVFKSS